MTNPPPLTGLKVLEFAGLAPGPYAGLLLADAGASVLRIDRAPLPLPPRPRNGSPHRHKRSIAIDLKTPPVYPSSAPLPAPQTCSSTRTARGSREARSRSGGDLCA
ncbi:hypothetical protein N0V88_002360 [Collariella sp. IMI 366227]|nr:hypothetical protein N0V88_002360 [Collariella sp. IMI 366227]